MHDDCATAARRSPALAGLMPAVRARAEEGQRRWPRETLDVPADADGRAHYEQLRSVAQAFSDVVYRTRLTMLDGADPRQEVLLASAVVGARRLLDDLAHEEPPAGDP